jgi:hypothetical protein
MHCNSHSACKKNEDAPPVHLYLATTRHIDGRHYPQRKRLTTGWSSRARANAAASHAASERTPTHHTRTDAATQRYCPLYALLATTSQLTTSYRLSLSIQRLHPTLHAPGILLVPIHHSLSSPSLTCALCLYMLSIYMMPCNYK